MRFSWKTICAVIVAISLSSAMVAAESKTISLGLVASLTKGPTSGISIRKGATLAVEEINANGGIKGHLLSLLVEDEKNSSAVGMEAFKRLIYQQKVLMVFGPTSARVSSAAHPIAQNAQVVAFSMNGGLSITDVGNFIFRNALTEFDILPETLRVAVANQSIKRVAVMYGSDDINTANGASSFISTLKKLKIPIVANETFTAASFSYTPALTRIKAANPDAIVLSAFNREASAIVQEARRIGLDIPIIGGNLSYSAGMFDGVPENVSDNLWVGDTWAIENATAENKAFVMAYTTKFSEPPDRYAARSYDAVHTVADALKKITLTGSLAKDRLALRDALPKVQRVGVTGAFRFRQGKDSDKNPAGYDAAGKVMVMVKKAGRYVIQK